MVDESAHPDEATWERLACGELGASERDAAMDHVVACDECSRVYRALAALQRDAAAFDPNVPAEPAGRRDRVAGLRWAYAAAAMAAGVGLVFVLQRGGTDQPPRAPRASPVRATATGPVTLEPRGTLAAPPRVFRWEGQPSADGYRMRLLSRDGTVIWASPQVTTTAVEVPADVRFADDVYFWEVSAHRAGERIGESELTRFTVRR